AIEFPNGISAVVGPNGCGKSNIVDALRWVMGEQSVKQLRGKNMEDVIFSGTNGKPPLNMAEVSLTLLNDNGSAPEELKDFTEINVTRRLYRSGESAYFINRQPCRLKDIHNVFMGSGMGAKTYAVIQQGNIGIITDAGPDERRLFIEEAAGVTRYKNRKKEALRKVASTHQNLLRVSDIITEVNRQMAGLKRQARKAERYKKYSDRLKTLNIHLGIHYYDEYAEKIADTSRLLQTRKDDDLQHASQLKKIDAAVEEIKLKRWEKNHEISAQKSQSFEAQRKIDRIETNIDHLRNEIERYAHEIIGLETAKNGLEEKNTSIIEEIDVVEKEYASLSVEKTAATSQIDTKQAEYQHIRDQLTQLNQQLEVSKSALMEMVAEEARYKNTYQNASNNKENLARRRNRIDQDIETAEQHVQDAKQSVLVHEKDISLIRESLAIVKNELTTLENQVNAKIEALSRQVKQTQSMEMERNQIRSQVSALKKLSESYAWYRDGVQAIMRIKPDQPGNKSPGSDNPEPPKAGVDTGFSKDIVGLMAEVIEPDPTYETAVESVLGDALQYIIVKNQDTGMQAIDYLQATGEGRGGFIPIPDIKPVSPNTQDSTGSSQRLLQHVSVKAGFENVANALLGHVFVADNLTQARTRFNRNGRIQTIVTKDGNIISHQGVFLGGSKEKLSNILTKRQELKGLTRQAAQLDKKVESERKTQESLGREVRKLEEALQKHIEKKENLLLEERQTEKNLYQAVEELKHARRHLEMLLLEREQLVGEENTIDVEISKFQKAITEIEQQVRNAQQTVTDTNEKISGVTEALERANQQIIDLRLKHTSLIASVENNHNTLRRLKDFWQDGLKRLEQLTRDITIKKEKRIALKEDNRRLDDKLSQMYEQFKQLKEVLQHNEADYLTIDEELQEKDGIVSNIQKARETTLQNIRLLELEQSQQTIKQENIANRLQEKYFQTIDQLRLQVERTPENTPLPVRDMEEEKERLASRISRIGDVNLGAIDEYDELKTRYDFLIEQQEDLDKAIQDLHKVIKKINRITQERFINTFNAVNEKLAEVFPRLFEGGTAKLILTDPDKPLETGVEYMIHPPGKKLTRMSLLSGGEKAMSAIAFIFSIFLIKPTSFCLMDEIDAPLDDANVFRFNDLLKVIGQKSQIIMITHNKRSMEFADTLFGITMGEKGVSKVVSVNLEQQAHAN
ncbi:MAG: chromosome segregation protein SMC, partial [Desulfobacterales bacterium]|nr:chromosome segregation protein SMC [Desulfobacterales bacterium]MDX2512085.1 chromosome segregation protein SMC [Desulfobacterales bacterium]